MKKTDTDTQNGLVGHLVPNYCDLAGIPIHGILPAGTLNICASQTKNLYYCDVNIGQNLPLNVADFTSLVQVTV